MPFDVQNANLTQLEKEFERLAEARTLRFTAYTQARGRLEEMLTEYQDVYGKIEVIDGITKQLLGSDPVSDGSPGDDPFESDLLDSMDEWFAFGGGATGLYAVFKLAKDVRAAHVLQKAGSAGSTAASSAGKAVMAWPKLKLAGGVVGLGVSVLGIALMIRDRQERETFYKENIPIYEAWEADLAAKILGFNTSTNKLDTDLDDLQVELGYASRDEMKNELRRTVGDVSEYRAQWTALTKMLCGGVSIADAVSYTGFPEKLVKRRAQEIVNDPGICPVPEQAS